MDISKYLMPSALLAIGALLIGVGFEPGGNVEGAAGLYEADQPAFAYALADFAVLFADANTCPYEDQSNGMGGQAGGCTYECPGQAGTQHLTVQADDPDASVSGSAACGATDLHCTGKQNCDDQGTYSGPSSGSCSGDSDEIYDSGLYVNCYADGEDSSTGGGGSPGDPGGPQCPITKPVEVCVDPGDIKDSDLVRALLSLCRGYQCSWSLSDGFAIDGRGNAGATLVSVGSVQVAAICPIGDECHLVRPSTLALDNGQTRLFI